MYEIIYLNKITNQRITETFWNKKEVDKFIKKINKNKNFILLAIYDSSYLYD